ncbi:uncharacterized protein [Rutidosis leptorrhynchoides]|uniref:uncharacterized protein n=1 Tax=Rutidosis leptorrhynchoides TaxID=125765 RepID=UPI003A996978
MEGVDVLVETGDECKMNIGNKRERSDDGEITKRLEKKPSGMTMVNQVFGELEVQNNNNTNTNYDYSYSGDEMINGVKYEEEKEDITPTPSPGSGTGKGTGTGFFNQIMTNLVDSPKSNLQTDDGSKKNDIVGEGEDGGNINNFISNIFSKNNNGTEVAVEEKDSVADAVPAPVVDDDGQNQNDDGVIDNIVAQLPRTLSEDAAPAADEASILMHSIIHD